VKSAPPGVPEKPELPWDIAGRRGILGFVEVNAKNFRLGPWDAARQALIAILSDEQYAQLYHYGFIEQRGQSGTILYRVHWHRGNNVSVFPHMRKYATAGLSCFVYSECLDDTIISNILALRTNEVEFCATACSEPPFESRHDDGYAMHDA